MPSIRILCLMLVSMVLTACGGGGSLESTGGGGSTGSYTITLELVNSQGTVIDEVSKDQVGTVRATLEKSGSAVSDQLISFSLLENNGNTLGVLDPEAGTAKTNSSGVAVITLRAGQVAGAGQITANYSDNGNTAAKTLTFTTKGDDGDTGSSQGTRKMTLVVLDKTGVAYTEANPVTKDNRGRVVATVTEDGVPVTSGLVSFTTEYTGKILSETGTNTLNNDGEAIVSLDSGALKGAGKVVAKLDGSPLVAEAFFFSSGDGATVEQAEAVVDVKLLVGCNSNWDQERDNLKLDPTDPTTGCTVISRDISSDQLGIIFVSVNNANTGDGFAGTLVNVETTVGNLLPSSGNAVTDNFGIALLTLQPGAQNDSGVITASSKGVSALKAFNVGVADISLTIDNGLTEVNGTVQPLAAGATTVITVNIFDTDGVTPLTLPLDVELTSSCKQAGKAELDAKVTSISGVATATYRALGCQTDQGDTVIATVNGNKTISTLIPLSNAEVSSIEFIGTTQNVIALKGTGGQGRTEASEVTFKLKDALGQAVSQGRVDFRLNSYNGGMSLEPKTVKTNTDGNAFTTVTSGTVPGAIRVQACYIPDDKIPPGINDDVTCWKDVYDACQADNTAAGCPSGTLTLLALDEQIISVSDLMTITSGLPDNNSFTLAADTINVEALQHAGEISNLTIFMADHFNNPVPDGTTVHLRAEGGAIGTLNGEQFDPLLACETTDGACTVQWRSQDPIPFGAAKWGNTVASTNPKTNAINCDLYFGRGAACENGITNAAFDANGVALGGRATVLAYAKGEETFIDRNANGVFDQGEFYSGYDVAEAFIDNNEDGQFNGNVDCSDPTKCLPTTTNAGEFEEFVDLNGDGSYTAADGKYNGFACSQAAEAAGRCIKNLVDLRRNIEIIMSGNTPYYRFAIPRSSVDRLNILGLEGVSGIDANCNNVNLSAPVSRSWIFEDKSPSQPILELEPSETGEWCDVKAVDISTYSVHVDDDNNPATPHNCDQNGYWNATNNFCDGTEDQAIDVGISGVSGKFVYADIYNNPLPAGTNVTAETTNGDYSGTEGFTIGNTSQTIADSIGWSIGREGQPNRRATGVLSFTFVTKKGHTTQATLTVRDDG